MRTMDYRDVTFRFLFLLHVCHVLVGTLVYPPGLTTMRTLIGSSRMSPVWDQYAPFVLDFVETS